ncbi:aspartyl-phosphate phosphatase Spo0E family protein [Bacillus sp. FJAT-45037]|uniref:aspartyl-phosphate phosphatase Spo0E family protein n=1 Tax=Bacillus sp. FJAT-45037 TaxID=2011007 RepID=UPI000C24F342|nr:aspartyl-phosphate phosphatase Spo0E family protein [Bacillus sp. FJAT-45037]
MEKQQLRDSIEQKRTELVKVGIEHGLHSPKAIKASQQLDDLLNQYDCLYHPNKIK